MTTIVFHPDVKEYLTNTPNLDNATKYQGMIDVPCKICGDNYMRMFPDDAEFLKYECVDCWVID